MCIRDRGTAKLKQKGKNFYQLQSKSADLKLTCEYAEQISSESKTFAEAVSYTHLDVYKRQCSMSVMPISSLLLLQSQLSSSV